MTTRVTKCEYCGTPTFHTGETEYQRGYRAGQIEMRERAARVALAAYYDCPAEQDPDSCIERAVNKIPVHNGHEGTE